MASRKAKARSSKKRHLDKAQKHTKLAPYWIIFKKFGKGKKVSLWTITHVKRSWRNRKLKIKPRRMTKQYLG